MCVQRIPLGASVAATDLTASILVLLDSPAEPGVLLNTKPVVSDEVTGVSYSLSLRIGVNIIGQLF